MLSMSMSCSSGRLSSRIPQPKSFRRASASATMETVNIDQAQLKTLNESYDAAITRQESTANRSDSGLGSSASSRRKNSLQRNKSMYERSDVPRNIQFRQQSIRIEKVTDSSLESLKLPKRSGLNCKYKDYTLFT